MFSDLVLENGFGEVKAARDDAIQEKTSDLRRISQDPDFKSRKKQKPTSNQVTLMTPMFGLHKPR
ncbi:hypothetical protein Hanom_Chr05g00392781 [Helianthus anomalus]